MEQVNNMRSGRDKHGCVQLGVQACVKGPQGPRETALIAVQFHGFSLSPTSSPCLKTLRINVCYWRERIPGSYGVSQAFPCFLWLGLYPHHLYGLPAGEYPGLMKVSRKIEKRQVDASADWGKQL